MKTSKSATPTPVANRYAQALFELATESRSIDAVYADLKALNELLASSSELEETLVGAALPVEMQQKLFKAIADKVELNAVVLRLCRLLISKRRMSVLPSLEDAFRARVDASRNTLRGRVTAAGPLSDAEAAELSSAFGRKLDKTVVLDQVIDKEVLGGLIVQVQGLTFDGSLKTGLRRLKENLERQSI